MADYRQPCKICGQKGINTNNKLKVCYVCKMKLGAYTKPKGKKYQRYIKGKDKEKLWLSTGRWY